MEKENDGFPVTVYDVENKKAVLIFQSRNSCAEYILVTKKENSGYLRYILKNSTRIKPIKNIFGKLLTVRYATEQKKLIPENEKFVVLDSDYERKDISRRLLIIRKMSDEPVHNSSAQSYYTICAGRTPFSSKNSIRVKCDKEKVEELMNKIEELFKQYNIDGK